MQIICTCIYILANKETSNSPGIGILTVTWKQNPENQGDSQVDPECTKDPTLPPHCPLPWGFSANPCNHQSLRFIYYSHLYYNDILHILKKKLCYMMSY